MEQSLRLRITPAECEQLLAGVRVSEQARFPGGWCVTVRSGPGFSLGSDQAGTVELVVDAESIATLARPEIEGIYPEINGVRVVVEKDFPCVHPRPSEAAETTETFPAPPGFAERKA